MFFQVEKVTKRIYRITMPYVCCYLIVGDTRAVLIDTGWGYGDLNKVIESITSLPVTLLLSHGHPDHLGGAIQYEDAYLNEEDFDMVESQSQISLRRQLMLRSVPSDFKEESNLWLPPRKQPYKRLTTNNFFDLGGVTIHPFELPGHSKGSMVFILPEERIAIFGDAISHPTLIVFDNSSSIQAHYEAMVHFKKYSHLYDRVLVNHESYELDKIVLDNNIELAKSILQDADLRIPASKRVQNISNKGMIYTARVPKQWLPTNAKEIGNIYYREDKI